MPSKIIIFRHGETDHNRYGIVQGWLDTSLNHIGHEQAEKLAEHLKNFKVDILYTSDLKRAFQTASKVAGRLGIKIKKTKLLRERDQGIFTDKTMEELKKDLSNMYKKYKDQSELHWKEHGGESRHDVRKRVEKFMKKLHKEHPNETIMIATHGGPKRELLRFLGLINDESIHFENTAVSIIKKTSTGVYKTIKLNSIKHLVKNG